ncbi:MAG: hypothetical protein NTV58_02870 [Deltaproteobacteria bacterium]|nr:hypothetical protein [Deltaproteobacteria bacterium]
MKRWLAVLFFVVFICTAPSFAVDQSDPYSVKSTTVKTVPIKPAPKKTLPRETRMRATGKVIEISPEAIKIERNVKGTVETMDFSLVKPLDKIKVGDEVGVSYIAKDNQNIAKRISKVTKKKVTPPNDTKTAVNVPPGTPGK